MQKDRSRLPGLTSAGSAPTTQHTWTSRPSTARAWALSNRSSTRSVQWLISRLISHCTDRVELRFERAQALAVDGRDVHVCCVVGADPADVSPGSRDRSFCIPDQTC